LSELTGSNVMKCPVVTDPDAKPTRVRPYRLNDEMRKEVDSQLDSMLARGIIAGQMVVNGHHPLQWPENKVESGDFA